MTNPSLLVGANVTRFEQMDELPIGSVICQSNNTGRAWEKRDDGQWWGIEDATGSGPHGPHAFTMGTNLLIQKVADGTPAPQETLRQFQWRFWENAVSGAHENGVSMDATLKGLRLIGLNRDDFPLGPSVRFKVLDDQTVWPEGAVIANAHRLNPLDESFTLFVRKRRSWASLLGKQGLGRDAVIMEYPGVESPPEWWTEVGDESSLAEVLQFKARAWRIGQQIKSEQSWCGTYEHVIARVGVSARSVREAAVSGGAVVGERVSQRDAARTPEGTLLFYRGEEWSDHWAVFRRENSQTNLCQTRRVAGHRNLNAPALGHYQTSMTVLSVPVGDDPAWVVDTEHVPQMLDILPSGTVFDYSGARYVICPDRLITQFAGSGFSVPARGMHRPYVFNAAQITLIRFEETA